MVLAIRPLSVPLKPSNIARRGLLLGQTALDQILRVRSFQLLEAALM